MAQHLVVACLFHVQDLALQREDRLESTITALLGGAAGALALNQVHFATFRLTFGTVRQLARQPPAVERALAAGEISSLASSFTSASSFNRFVDDLPGNGWVLIEERR